MVTVLCADGADQTGVFSGGSTSSYRPNLKLTLLPNEDGSMIVVDPTSLDYGEVAVGTTEVQTFTIQNIGNEPSPVLSPHPQVTLWLSLLVLPRI